MNPLRAWMQAARPLAFVNIALPIALGTALGASDNGRLDPGGLWAALWFGSIDQLVIVFANEVADQRADRHNEHPTFLSGGSRVLVDGLVSPRALARAAALAGLALVAFSTWQAFSRGATWMPALAVAALTLLWAYSFPPLRLSYRGHGELLQGLGTGVVLVLVGHQMQGAPIESFHVAALLPTFLLGVASNIVTSLPDHPADRRAQKRTYAVRRGQWTARRDLLQIVFAAALLTPFVVDGVPPWLWAASVVLVGSVVVWASRLLGTADAENRAECLAFVVRGAVAVNLASVVWIASLALVHSGVIEGGRVGAKDVFEAPIVEDERVAQPTWVELRVVAGAACESL
jgi:1,4-dihydroxy-2-naphthoate octaprenyltransferase